MPCIQTHLASSHLFFCHNAAFCAEVIVAEEAVEAIVAYHVSFLGEQAPNTTLEIRYYMCLNIPNFHVGPSGAPHIAMHGL